MPDDIVERLRVSEEFSRKMDRMGLDILDTIFSEAADEIQRLRKQCKEDTDRLSFCADTLDQQSKELIVLRAEIESFRTALATAQAAEAQMRADAVKAARTAKLPDYFQWGCDAMEQFEVGKRRAAEAIEVLPLASEGRG